MTTRTCPRCGDPIQFLDPRCASCGADLAVELEIAAFHQPAIDSARKMIFWAGVIYLLIPVLIFAMLARLAGGSVFATSAFALAFGVGAAIFAGHVGLWWWAKRSPLPATLIAFAVFLVYVAVTGVADGLVIKVVGFVVLARAVLASNRVRKLRAGGGTTALAGLAMLVLGGCYGAAPPRPQPVALPASSEGTPIVVDSRTSTRIELVDKKSETCPQGHASGSQACIVTRYQEREPVTRTTTTAYYGDTPLSYAQFAVLTDPAYDDKLVRLDRLREQCREADLPRWAGTGLAIAGLVALGVGGSRDSRTMTVGGEIGLAGGLASYVLGYYSFGGKRCNQARSLYRQVELSGAASVTEVAGAADAAEMKQVADRFNQTVARSAAR